MIDPMLDDAAYQAKRMTLQSRLALHAPLYDASFRVDPEEQMKLAARLLAETAAWGPGKKYPALPLALRRAIAGERGSTKYKLAVEQAKLPEINLDEEAV